MTENINGYPVKNYGRPTKRYVQTLDLRDNKELIAAYRACHAPDGIWPEIIEGIKAVGILEMEIYIRGCRLVMIVETPADFEWETAMKKLSTLPRQDEWENHVAQFQNAASGTTSDEKWQLMERMFYLY